MESAAQERTYFVTCWAGRELHTTDSLLGFGPLDLDASRSTRYAGMFKAERGKMSKIAEVPN